MLFKSVCKSAVMDNEWKHCVNRLLRAWTGYQLALRMLSGGSQTYQKSEWFSEASFVFCYEWTDLITYNKVMLDRCPQ